MKLLVSLSTILILYFVYGFYISQYDIGILPSQLRKENFPGYYDYHGIINVHTDLSLGTASINNAISAARNTGQDFILFTDLNIFNNPVESYEGYHGNTLALIGAKYGYLDSRIIYYSLSRESIGDNLGEIQVHLSDIFSQNNKDSADRLLVLAHPFKTGFNWQGDIPESLDGFEIINIKSLGVRAWEISKLSTVWSLITFPFNPNLSFVRLFSEPSEELNLFDRLGSNRKIVGYAGAEASARAVPLAQYALKFPSYHRSFELFSNHVLLNSELTGNSIRDRQKIFSALKNGQFYLCFDMIGDPKGFNAWVEDKFGKHFPMGSTVTNYKNSFLKVHLPLPPTSFFEVVIYKDGLRYETFNELDVSMPLKEPGAYRVQVRVIPYLPLPDAKKWITWIYTNHFYIR